MNTPMNHFLVTALAIYERDGVQKQRHLNIHAANENAFLNRASLSAINVAIVDRLTRENAVDPSQIKDVVILNISYLGVMTDEEFSTAPAPTEETVEQPAPEATPA